MNIRHSLFDCRHGIRLYQVSNFECRASNTSDIRDLNVVRTYDIRLFQQCDFECRASPTFAILNVVTTFSTVWFWLLWLHSIWIQMSCNRVRHSKVSAMWFWISGQHNIRHSRFTTWISTNGECYAGTTFRITKMKQSNIKCLDDIQIASTCTTFL